MITFKTKEDGEIYIKELKKSIAFDEQMLEQCEVSKRELENGLMDHRGEKQVSESIAKEDESIDSFSKSIERNKERLKEAEKVINHQFS